MAWILTSLAWLKGLSFLGRIGALLSPMTVFVPGANVLALPLAIFQFIGNVIKWTWKGVEDCFTHPATFLVCFAFSIGGAYGMAKFVGHRVSDLRVELKEVRSNLVVAETEVKEWRQRDQDQKDRAAAAEKARKEAEANAKTAVVPAAPAPAGRVYRQSPAAAVKPSSASGFWLPRF